MILAHSIALDPNRRQSVYFARAAGTARFAWNNALAAWNEAYEADGKVDSGKLQRGFNAIRREEFPWMGEVSYYVYAYPWIQLRKAFGAFFRKKARHPKFRAKHRSPESFYVCHREMEFDGRTLRLGPKKFNLGPIRMREELRFKGKVMGATVRRDGDRWMLSVQVNVGDNYRKERVSDGTVGVDLGITTLATLARRDIASDPCGSDAISLASTGEIREMHCSSRCNAIPRFEKIEGPKPLKKNLSKLRRVSRQHSRKKKGSKNREKSRLRLARLHRRIRNIRKDAIHRLTTKLCRENQAVAVEDLSVRGMMRNGHLAKWIADMGWYEFRRQLGYKCLIYGTRLVVAGRFFPSSKRCSACGAVRAELPLGERVYRCPCCGLEMDRDLNAAINLLNLLPKVPVNDGEPDPSQARVETPVERKALAVRGGGNPAAAVKPPRRSRKPAECVL